MDLVEEAGAQRAALWRAAARSARRVSRARRARPGPEGLRAGGRSHHARHHPPAGARTGGCGLRSTPATAMRSRRRSTTSSITPSRLAAQLGSTGSKRRWSRRSSSPTCSSAPASRSLKALRCLRTGTDLGPHLVEIHRLENEGDRLQRDGVASLFVGGIDPMVVIRWKDIFESLEAAVDACETVAHVLEGITLKQRRRWPGGELRNRPKLLRSRYSTP